MSHVLGYSSSFKYALRGCSSLFTASTGSLVVSPFSLVEGLIDRFNPYWQVQHVALSICLFLFGITYRYAVRGDNNPQLKQGIHNMHHQITTMSIVQHAQSQSVQVLWELSP